MSRLSYVCRACLAFVQKSFILKTEIQGAKSAAPGMLSGSFSESKRTYTFSFAFQTVAKTYIKRWSGSQFWPDFSALPFGATIEKSIGRSGRLPLISHSACSPARFLRLWCSQDNAEAVITVTDKRITAGFVTIDLNTFFVEVCDETGVAVAGELTIDQKTTTGMAQHCHFGSSLLFACAQPCRRCILAVGVA